MNRTTRETLQLKIETSFIDGKVDREEEREVVRVKEETLGNRVTDRTPVYVV